jgi:hypothetical protein
MCPLLNLSNFLQNCALLWEICPKVYKQINNSTLWRGTHMSRHCLPDFLVLKPLDATMYIFSSFNSELHKFAFIWWISTNEQQYILREIKMLLLLLLLLLLVLLLLAVANYIPVDCYPPWTIPLMFPPLKNWFYLLKYSNSVKILYKTFLLMNHRHTRIYKWWQLCQIVNDTKLTKVRSTDITTNSLVSNFINRYNRFLALLL